MENVITENAVTAPEVVAPEQTNAEVVSENAANTSGEAVAKPRQSAEDNRAFAAMRRELERVKAESAEKEKQLSRLASVMNAEGYAGLDAISLADSVEAAKEGVSPDQIRSRRETRAKEIEDAVKAHPDFIRNKTEAEQFRELLQKRQFESDIAELNNKYPDADIKSVEDLGEAYRKLRANGIDNETAYLATVGKGKIAVQETTPEIGAANGSKAIPEKEFYSNEELDRLCDPRHKKELDNPEVWEKVLRSIRRQKK